MAQAVLERKSTARTSAAGRKQKPRSGSKASPKSKGKKSRDLGTRGEDAAARYLYMHGYDILERNWKCKAGEADIIARDGNTLVFVEVKTRTNTEKGFPSEAVSGAKRDRYEKIALFFLKDFDEVDIPVRFDVMAIVVSGKDRAFIRHHINAFAVD